jgi:hypothetical protein
MKNNVIDIIRRSQTHHALQEEHERKHSHASVAPSSDKNMDVNRSRPNESTRDGEFPAPHVERVVRTIRVGRPATVKATTPRPTQGDLAVSDQD